MIESKKLWRKKPYVLDEDKKEVKVTGKWRYRFMKVCTVLVILGLVILSILSIGATGVLGESFNPISITNYTITIKPITINHQINLSPELKEYIEAKYDEWKDE